LIGKDEGLGRNANQVSQEPVQITLKIPTGLMSWIEKIARANQSTIPEATVYAIEYGFRVFDSQGKDGVEGLRKAWRDIFQVILLPEIQLRRPFLALYIVKDNRQASLLERVPRFKNNSSMLRM
jgi:hypothetical protein